MQRWNGSTTQVIKATKKTINRWTTGNLYYEMNVGGGTLDLTKGNDVIELHNIMSAINKAVGLSIWLCGSDPQHGCFAFQKAGFPLIEVRQHAESTSMRCLRGLCEPLRHAVSCR